MHTLRPLLNAADAVLAQLHNGELFCDEEKTVDKTCQAFDRLERAVGAAKRELDAQALAARDQSSPFLRYRSQILGGYGTAARLRALVLHLYNGGNYPVRLDNLLAGADQTHVQIAMDLIGAYGRLGENDPAFMTLAREIREDWND
ncbi:MAG: hypothetical protein HYV16_12145 [Gammaproteobacteria bacterium]|nr:hypothetical protein [Gammaproteobacteria bacterium]